ncbi:DUF2332 domain-containing protein [Novosphingobium aquae]|uniref:DUF2332 domain-containing protein n=1 Tax=Novosphingobium aquae TaxID=3133435 RepID=A0ABU8S7J3_9SPHN
MPDTDRSTHDIVMEEQNVVRTLEWQADHATRNGAPCTGRLVRAFIPLLAGPSKVGQRMREWPGLSLEDAMPLRLAGGLHYLHLTGAEQRLGLVYRGEMTDADEIEAVVAAVVADHDAALAAWFAGPPQTNEAGRSAGIMAQLLWLSGRLGPRFELNEIGSSAGINTMMDRFAFDLCGVMAGVEGSPMLIRPEWRGPPQPDAPVEIVSIRGCDIQPIDLADPAEALRLKSYVWPDAPERLARIDAAIALAAQQPPDVDQMDAADWVERRLAEPQAEGVTRVLFHSIVWQYIPENGRARIETAMAQAGARATAERPLAWVTVETNRQTFRHELRCRFWPGGEEEALLGEAHAHGAWVEWFG